MSDLRFFNPYAEIRHTENRLPHWQQEGAVYFVTFRLADAVPTRLRNQREMSATAGYGFIINHGRLRSNSNIISDSPGQLSVGWMLATDLACCGAMIAQKSLPRHCAISKGNGCS